MKKILLTIISCLTLIAIVYYARQFNSQKNEIDHFSELFAPVKKILASQAKPSAISLITDENDVPLYYQLQFVLAPYVLEYQNTAGNTIIIMKKHGSKKTDFHFDRYQVLYTKSDTYYYITVLSKK